MQGLTRNPGHVGLAAKLGKDEMSNLKRMTLMSAAACAFIAQAAFGQADGYYSRDKYEAVRDRAQPEFDPEPVRLGTFLVRSNAELGITSNDNIFATSASEQSDVIARAGAQVSATTDWSVHAVGIDASAFQNEYQDFGDESFSDLTGRVRGRLDVSRSFSLGGAVFAEKLNEPRYEFVNDSSADKPIEYTRTGAVLDANYENDRVRWVNSFGVTEEDFEDGTSFAGLNVDQDFRDRSETNARSRLSYAVSPNFAVFTQGSISNSEYDSEQLLAGALRSRDSKGYTIAGGVNFELVSLIRGDIAVGYLNEEKDDAFFADVSGLSVDADIQWFPTRLTTVNFNAARRVVDVGAFNSPSALETRFGAGIDHELRRNILLSGYAGIATYDYEETDRKDETLEFGASATYKMNKRVHWEVFARNRERDVSGSGVFGDPSYSQAQFGIGLKLYP